MQSLRNLFSGYQQLPEQAQPTSAQQSTHNDPSLDLVGSQHLMDTPDPEQPSPAPNPFLITTTLTSINSSSLPTPAPTPQPTSQPLSSWFTSSLWVSPQNDEMNLQYDIESGQTASQAIHTTDGKLEVGSEQRFALHQRFAIFLYHQLQRLTAFLPALPELTYPQRLLVCAMFGIGGIFLLISSLLSLPQLFFGGASKFAYSFTLANVFFIIASLFITDPKSHFAANRRFTTILYLASLALTLLTCAYLPYLIFVLPILLIQIAATVFHLLSFFTSAVNMEMNLGHQVLASIFRQAI